VGPALKEWISKRPHVKLCFICGDVKSPGQYELQEGSIFDVLKMAGGTASGTTDPRMRVYRTNRKLFGGSEMEAWEYEASERDTRSGRYQQTVKDADIIVVGDPEKAK
jgi:protein involved in polysaccharide export with SLBB domain